MLAERIIVDVKAMKEGKTAPTTTQQQSGTATTEERVIVIGRLLHNGWMREKVCVQSAGKKGAPCALCTPTGADIPSHEENVQSSPKEKVTERRGTGSLHTRDCLGSVQESEEIVSALSRRVKRLSRLCPGE